jgi:hypothetical protein
MAMAGTDNIATQIAVEILFILFPLDDSKVELIVDARGKLTLPIAVPLVIHRRQQNRSAGLARARHKE